MKNTIYLRFFKRPFDISVALLAILIFFPLLLIISLLVKLNLGSPIIFKQSRPGLNEKIFTLYKFRSMTNSKDKDGKLLSNKLRITKFGRFLRATSLDELPSLINVLKGEMSIVGPRPLLVDYLEIYTDEQKKRHIVKPGLTGLAQINGRNSILWQKKFDYDINYIKEITFRNDLIIIWKTIFKILKKENINNKENLTMEKFNGKN